MSTWPPATHQDVQDNVTKLYPTAHTDWRTHPNGTPTSDDGGTLVINPTSGTGVMSVSGGTLVASVDGVTAKASYLQEDLGSDVHRIGAEFSFGSGTASQGSVTLVAWATIIPPVFAVPDSPCHFTITPLGWTFMYWVSGSSTQIGSGTFATALAQDGTVYRAEVQRRGTTAHLLLPDGTTAQVTDSHVGSISAPIASHEIFLNAAGGASAAFVRTWADPDPSPLGLTAPSDVARVLNNAPFLAAPATVRLAPGSAANVAVPSSTTTIDASLTVIVTVPASGKLLITLSAWLDVAASASIFWGIYSGATALIFRTVQTEVSSRLVTLTGLATGLTPGSVLTLDWRHSTTVTNAGTFVRLNAPAGHEATMAITPVN